MLFPVQPFVMVHITEEPVSDSDSSFHSVVEEEEELLDVLDDGSSSLSEESILKKFAEQKELGNNAFRAGDFDRALECYEEAIEALKQGGEVEVEVEEKVPVQKDPEDGVPSSSNPTPETEIVKKKVMRPKFSSELSICHGNSGAVLARQEKWESCVTACSDALYLDENYDKVRRRRAEAYEKLDKTIEAFEDWKKVHAACKDPREEGILRRKLGVMEKKVNEIREKQKEQMMGQLKELGNKLLGNFGLSLDNFKATKDPNTGQYSINFQQ